MARTLAAIDAAPLEAHLARTNLSPDQLVAMGRLATESHRLWLTNRDAIVDRAVSAVINALRTMEPKHGEGRIAA